MLPGVFGSSRSFLFHARCKRMPRSWSLLITSASSIFKPSSCFSRSRMTLKLLCTGFFASGFSRSAITRSMFRRCSAKSFCCAVRDAIRSGDDSSCGVFGSDLPPCEELLLSTDGAMEVARCFGLCVRQSAIGNCCLITSGSGEGGWTWEASVL